MTITQQLLDKLTAQAKENPRLRQSYDLRNTPEDDSQRMLNAIEPGSEMPIHRHKFTSETVVCLRGCLVEEFFDELERICTDRIELTPNGPVVAVNVPAGQWHRVYAKCSPPQKTDRLKVDKKYYFCNTKTERDEEVKTFRQRKGKGCQIIGEWGDGGSDLP